jgi:ribosomal protein L32
MPYQQLVSNKPLTNECKKLDYVGYSEVYQELVDSARFPLPPSPTRLTAPSPYNLCPSCGDSPIATSITLYSPSYYTPQVMSDASANLSVESPMEDVSAWDDTPALPVLPPLSQTALRTVALAPPISPRSALALLNAHNDIDPDTLRSIARGLTVTMSQRDV